MTAAIDVGSPAPDFVVATPEGEVSSQSLRGRPYVLYFYPKDDTPACTQEAQGFSALASEFAAKGATIIGVSKDTAASHRKFREKYDLAVTLGTDADAGLAKAFGVWVEKSMYGRTYMGPDRATFLVDAQGTVRKVWRKVKVKGHAEDVLAAVSKL